MISLNMNQQESSDGGVIVKLQNRPLVWVWSHGWLEWTTGSWHTRPEGHQSWALKRRYVWQIWNIFLSPFLRKSNIQLQRVELTPNWFWGKNLTNCWAIIDKQHCDLVMFTVCEDWVEYSEDAILCASVGSDTQLVIVFAGWDITNVMQKQLL